MSEAEGPPVIQTSHDWLEPLLERYRRVVEARVELRESFNSLRLASTVGRRLALVGTAADPGVQVAVLGPTQAGKSTLVNALIGARTDAAEPQAGVSALAGYTVHAQAFELGSATGGAHAPGLPGAPADEREAGRRSRRNNAERSSLDALMAPLERWPFATLRDAPLAAWSLESVVPGRGALLDTSADATATARRFVVWDTPDFDSIKAGSYRESVLAVAGLADVVVLMLSKDKYGDRTVWDMLALLADLGLPVVVVINKLDPADEPTVRTAFAKHHGERFGTPLPPLIALPWIATAAERSPAIDSPALRAALVAAIDESSDITGRRAALDRFVATRQAGWLAPVHAELAARDAWRDAVTNTADRAIDEYASRYLDDPDRYDTFDRTLAELLTLLEIPGIARTLANTRRIVTWPARKLIGAGRNAVRGARPPIDRELEVLDTVLDHATVRLREVVLDQLEASSRDSGSNWWRALEREIVAAREPLKRAWMDEAIRVRTEFEPRIEAAAGRLYEQLKDQPALLNTLRAARVTTDAAGVALALKSGGLAPADLVLAPAMLGVTTLLTESALGRYLEGVKRDLKREQRELVRRRLIDGVLKAAFLDAARARDTDDRLLAAEPDPALRRVLRSP